MPFILDPPGIAIVGVAGLVTVAGFYLFGVMMSRLGPRG